MTKGWRAISSWRSPRAVLLIFFLLVAHPAFFTGCTITEPDGHLRTIINNDGNTLTLDGRDSVHTKINFLIASADVAVKAETWWAIKRIDILVFNDDDTQMLDSYSREYGYTGNHLTAASSSGDKIVVAIANSQLSNEELGSVRVYEDINNLWADISDESPEYPLMTGESRMCAGSDMECTLVLYPMLSEIHISSLSCNMTGAFSGKNLQKVRAYLTNVNSRTEMMRWDGFRPSDIINSGRLVESDMQKMKYQRLLYNYIGNGQRTSGSYNYGSSTLYCFPNDTKEESAGSPFTTLVIEGTLDGKTQYYPIRINRQGYGHSVGAEGISRNARYVMNITITGPGADDPDGEVPSRNTVTQGSMTLHPGNFITGRDGERLHVWVDVFPEETEVWIDEDDLDFDRERGIYDYEIDEDGKGVWLTLLKGGSGAFIINAGEPVNDGLLVIIVVNP